MTAQPALVSSPHKNRSGSRTPQKKAVKDRVAAVPSRLPRTTIQIVPLTKQTLDQIKEMEHLETYDEVINFLFRERRKNLPSTAGLFPSGGSFEREEDDSHRVPS